MNRPGPQDRRNMSDMSYDDVILDSTEISPMDRAGNPIPVTIPIDLAQGVKVIYTTRLGGSSEGDYASCNLAGKAGDDPEHVRANRKALAKVLNATISLVSQVHSGVAVDIDGGFGRNESNGTDQSGSSMPALVEADGQVTSRIGVALGMFAADCLPVLLADERAGVVAAAHCGRRGLQRGVIGATVDMMRSKGAKPERMAVTLGPRICGDCYEVGSAIADEFDAQFPGSFTLTRFGGPGIDIATAAMQELSAAGIPRDSIIESRPRISAATEYLSDDPELGRLCRQDGEGEAELSERIRNIRHSMCTLENPLWYSHRRASLANKAHEGRMLALIVREW